MSLTIARAAWDTASKWTITHATSGFCVTLTDLGAALLEVIVPDASGKLENITITQDTPSALISRKGSQGVSVGRTANRINRGKFSLEGKDYTLAVNCGIHNLHGGLVGWGNKPWHFVKSGVENDVATVEFKYDSPHLEEGYPGRVIAHVAYEISPMKISWTFTATSDAVTIVNLTNHAYWNLEGIKRIDDHKLTVKADGYMPVDENTLPIGDVVPFDAGKHNIDLRSPKKLSEVFATFGGVDHSFALVDNSQYVKNEKSLHFAAEVSSDVTGRVMRVSTTEPQVQVYTGEFTHEIGECQGGHKLEKRFAICLETQRAPDAINNPKFAHHVILKPEEVYYHKTVHEFSVRK